MNEFFRRSNEEYRAREQQQDEKVEVDRIQKQNEVRDRLRSSCIARVDLLPHISFTSKLFSYREHTYKGYVLGSKLVKNQFYYLVVAECPYPDCDDSMAPTGWVKEEDIIEVLE